MRHQDGFLTSVGDARIYHQSWLPNGTPKAAIVLVHGLAEHSGRYSNLIAHMVAQNIAVHGLDHIGHGKSAGTRVYAERFSDFTHALGSFVDHIRMQQPDIPMFLYGHSVGALIAAVFLIDHSIDLAGVIFSGPCVKVPANVSSTTVFLAKVLSRIAPKLGLSAVDASGISRDPAQVKAYIDDPLVYNGKTTARLACELLKAMRRVAAEAAAITLPALIVQGSADTVIDPDGANLLHDWISSEDKTLKIYAGLYHEIHNEPEHQDVLADISAWLEQRLR
ncbi:MAG: alpha/beta hydrolase [Candidatus Atribacteria bacterium]|nr:MAG: alpha/beta hydrolase [Candidatus Atribacteria bacterium]